MRLEEIDVRETPSGESPQLVILWRAIRPLHWVKNVFVFAPLLFAGQLTEAPAVLNAWYAFGLFCLAASGIYLMNDVWDREVDRQHPSKSMRPITQGSLSAPAAVRASIVFILLALGGSAAMGWAVFFVTSVYVTTHLLYTFALKKILIVDAVVIAFGFVLRVLTGALAIGAEASQWILLSTFFLALLIAFSKRRYEIFYDDETPPANPTAYSAFLLDVFVMVSGAAVISAYVGYVMARGAWQNGYALLVSVAVVVFGILRYLAIIYQNDERLDHTKMILTDRPLMGAVLIWIGLTIAEIYFFKPQLPS